MSLARIAVQQSRTGQLFLVLICFQTDKPVMRATSNLLTDATKLSLDI